ELLPLRVFGEHVVVAADNVGVELGGGGEHGDRVVLTQECLPLFAPDDPQRGPDGVPGAAGRSEEHTSELQSRFDLVCRLLLEQKKRKNMSSAASPDIPEQQPG